MHSHSFSNYRVHSIWVCFQFISVRCVAIVTRCDGRDGKLKTIADVADAASGVAACHVIALSSTVIGSQADNGVTLIRLACFSDVSFFTVPVRIRLACC